MASSSPQTSDLDAFNVHDPATIRKINDAVYQFHRPARGSIDIEIIFFHGSHAQGRGNAYLTTWMLADGSASWLNTWLPDAFPQSRILSVAYDSSTQVTGSDGRMDVYAVGENLAQSIIHLAGVGQSCPVVLVGHGVGGLLLKEVCCRAEQLANRVETEGAGIYPYETFLQRMKGAFFFSTPHLETLVQADRKRRSPLLKYFELLSSDSTRLNLSFQDLRKRYRWKTSGILGTNTSKSPETMRRPIGWKPQSSPVVDVARFVRNDLDEFSFVAGKDSSTICRLEDRSSLTFQILLKFLRGIIEDEERIMRKLEFALQLPPLFISRPNRLEQVLETLRLDEPEPSGVALVGMGGIGKTTLAKELLLRIRSQFHFISFVHGVKGRLKQPNLDCHSLIASNLYYGSGAKVSWMQDASAKSLFLLVKGKKVLLILDDGIAKSRSVLYCYQIGLEREVVW